MLRTSRRGTKEQLAAETWLDVQPPFEKAHYIDGFGYPDGKFRFKPDWGAVPASNIGAARPLARASGAARPLGRARDADAGHAVPARHEPRAVLPEQHLQRDPSSLGARGGPKSWSIRSMRTPSASRTAIGSGSPTPRRRDAARAPLRRAEARVLIAESIWPNDAYPDGRGINTLTAATRSRPMAARPSTTTGSGSSASTAGGFRRTRPRASHERFSFLRECCMRMLDRGDAVELTHAPVQERETYAPDCPFTRRLGPRRTRRAPLSPGPRPRTCRHPTRPSRRRARPSCRPACATPARPSRRAARTSPSPR